MLPSHYVLFYVCSKGHVLGESIICMCCWYSINSHVSTNYTIVSEHCCEWVLSAAAAVIHYNGILSSKSKASRTSLQQNISQCEFAHRFVCWEQSFTWPICKTWQYFVKNIYTFCVPHLKAVHVYVSSELPQNVCVTEKNPCISSQGVTDGSVNDCAKCEVYTLDASSVLHNMGTYCKWNKYIFVFFTCTWNIFAIFVFYRDILYNTLCIVYFLFLNIAIYSTEHSCFAWHIALVYNVIFILRVIVVKGLSF